MDVTRTHLDVLQAIESCIVRTYRRRPEVADQDALWAIEELEARYRDESRGFTPKEARVQGPGREIHDAVWDLCERDLGRRAPPAGDAAPQEARCGHSLSLEELKTCLLRVRKSIQKWNKANGQRGYLDFVSRFV